MTIKIVCLSIGLLALPVWAAAGQKPGDPVPITLGQTFPKLEASFLTGRKAVLPDAAKGKIALVMMGFSYDSRFAVEKWAEHFKAAWGTSADVTFFEVPVIGGLGRMASWFIDSGMRKGTPKELHENVITQYGSVDQWKIRMGYVKTEPDAAYLALLDRDGRVVWLAHGPYRDELFAALKTAIDAELQRGREPGGPTS